MMICSRCNQTGIRWMGPYGSLSHTECPHCRGINCQKADSQDDDEDLQALMDRDMED